MFDLSRPMPDVFSVEVFSPSGDRHVDLANPRSPVILLDAGIAGLVGSPVVSTASSIGVAGQVITGAVAQPIEGTLSCLVQALGVRDVSAVMAWFRGVWSNTAESMLIIAHPRFGRWSLPVRLSGALPAPGGDPADGGDIVFDVPLIGDGGVWLSDSFSSQHTENIVTVTNYGDVPVSPRIVWNGAGGEVKLPSGATFTLPPVSQPRVLSLAWADGLKVTAMDGVLDREVWVKVRGKALSEQIPVGESGVFQLPDGASLEWRIGVYDPWKG